MARAHLHLVDKEYFLVTRIVDLLLAEPSYAAGTRLTQEDRLAALTLYRARRSAGCDWGVFLAAFVELVRIKRRHRPDRRVLERSFGRGMRWWEMGWARRPRVSSTGSAAPGCGLC